jgi:site-specific recombinase XerD
MRAMPRAGEASPNRGKSYEKEVYTREEMKALLDRTSSNSPSAVRNKALLTTMWQSGLRVTEALTLLPSDFDLVAPEIFVRHGKGDKPRRVEPGPAAVQSTERWLEVRAGLGLPRDVPLFCTLRGTKLSDKYVRQTMHRLARRAGWSKRAHPHGLRHTYAVELTKKHVPLPMISSQLGHTSLTVTQIYLSGITSADVHEAMKGVWDDE